MAVRFALNRQDARACHVRFYSCKATGWVAGAGLVMSLVIGCVAGAGVESSVMVAGCVAGAGAVMS